MKTTPASVLLLMAMFLPGWAGASAAPESPAPALRPPAVPLVTHDPYFCIWSAADRLTDNWPRHWTGRTQALAAMIRIDGKTFRIMGPRPSEAPPMKQTSVRVFPTRTVYTFEDSGVALTLTFLCPLLIEDLDVMSRPVTYVTVDARASDGKSHAAAFYFDASAEIAVNTPDEKVTWSRIKVPGLDVLSFGTREQPVLEKSGDDLRIDWGYFYLALPSGPGTATALAAADVCRRSFAGAGTVPDRDDTTLPRAVNDLYPVAAAALDLGSVGSEGVSRTLMLAYDDRFSIEYFYRKLRPYWRRTGWQASDLLLAAAADAARLRDRCRALDDALMADMVRAGGEKYALVGALAYRQSIAAHKLCADIDGTPLFFPRENFSNGCISTVDVIYPEAPMYVLMSPALTRALLRPVLDYAAGGQWPFPFAPHDLGTYPLANGQVYGGGNKTEEDQMPVEESGNMLIMMAALAQAEGSPAFAVRYWDLMTRWAAYLKEKGFDPENQLCTDDFAGHLAHNTNLSLKAILGLRSYAWLCERTGRTAEAKAYAKTAADFALEWANKADDGDHFRLAFDRPSTWSQKYNLVWDRILGFNLFPAAVARKELDYYLKAQLKYGLPLDNRKAYTKLDWLYWTATMAADRETFDKLTDPIFAFLNDTPDRVPMTDWYATDTSRKEGFQARPVVGGVLIKMLADPALRAKWQHLGTPAAK